jgi:CheY-like chemotaxis protein
MNDPLFRILLVEDNAADAYLFRKALENAELNFELLLLEDGAQALAFVRGEGAFGAEPAPDLVVLDLNLPKSDGTEVLQAIRQSRHLSKIPVVITSSSSSPHDRAKTEHLVVERYIMKPLDLDDFLQIGAVVKQVLLENTARQHSQRREP